MTLQSRPVGAKYCPDCHSVHPVDLQFCPKHGTRLEDVERVLAGKFVLRSLLGTGSMGTVYEAVQLPMGRKVAIKLLRAELCSSAEMVSRFEREAQAASSFEHKNAITIYDSGHAKDGEVYIAMEYLQGESLAQVLRREDRLPAARAFDLWLPAVEAMAAAHEKGVVHRDLKPDNIFIAQRKSRRGDQEQVKVLDFGIAKIREGLNKNLTQTGLTRVHARIGTPLYMAPEQIEGREADPRSDVYALGLILVELLTGRLPWGGPGEENLELVSMQRLVRPPASLAALCPGAFFSAELQRLLDEVLAQDASKRPADAGDLLHRVQEVPEAAQPGASARNDSSLMLLGGKVSGSMSATPSGFPAGVLPASLVAGSLVGPVVSGPGLPALDNPFLYDEETDIQPAQGPPPGMLNHSPTPTQPTRASSESIPTRPLSAPPAEPTPTRPVAALPGPITEAVPLPPDSGGAQRKGPLQPGPGGAEGRAPFIEQETHPVSLPPSQAFRPTVSPTTVLYATDPRDPFVAAAQDAGQASAPLAAGAGRYGPPAHTQRLNAASEPTGRRPRLAATLTVWRPKVTRLLNGPRRWVLVIGIGAGVAIALLLPALLGGPRNQPSGLLPDVSVVPDGGASGPSHQLQGVRPDPNHGADPSHGPDPGETPNDNRRPERGKRHGHRAPVLVETPQETPGPVTPPVSEPKVPAPDGAHLPTVLQVQFLVPPAQQKVSISCATRRPLLVSCGSPTVCSAVSAVSPGEQCQARLPERPTQTFSYDALRRHPIKGSLLQVQLDLAQPQMAPSSAPTSANPKGGPPRKHR